jgi:peptidylprolyl isomerase
VRKASALIATAGLVMAALTACASPGTAQASCDAPVSAGAASKLVSVSGDFGSAPDVTFPTPLKSASTQRTEVIAGSGERIVPGQKISTEFNLYNGTTGAAIQQSAFDGSTAVPIVLNESTLPGFVDGLLCAQVGARVAIVIAPEDAFGPAGGNAQFQVAETDSLVLVVDIVKAFLPRADGTDRLVANGLPAVVLDADGTPGIVVPSGDAPTELEIGVLKKGSGAKVQEDSTVTLNYTGVLWKEKTVFDSSWENGSPVEFVPTDLIPGMSAALTGQTVGSQIVAVIPPAQAYGKTASGAVPADSTLIFVFDILGIN